MSSARFCRLPKPLPYPEAVSLQKRLVADRVADRIPDTLLLLEHPPVITLGRRGRREHLLVDEDRLRQAGVALHPSQRGGDVTVHAPGQWVLYPILKLGRGGLGAHGYLHTLEAIALSTAATFGIDAFRREGMAGAWTEQGKFAAIGFAMTRWVSWHGLSLNVNLDVSLFELVVGCGLVGESVTSFEQVLAEKCPGMDDVALALKEAAGQHFGREFEEIAELYHSPT